MLKTIALPVLIVAFATTAALGSIAEQRSAFPISSCSLPKALTDSSGTKLCPECITLSFLSNIVVMRESRAPGNATHPFRIGAIEGIDGSGSAWNKPILVVGKGTISSVVVRSWRALLARGTACSRFAKGRRLDTQISN